MAPGPELVLIDQYSAEHSQAPDVWRALAFGSQQAMVPHQQRHEAASHPPSKQASLPASTSGKPVCPLCHAFSCACASEPSTHFMSLYPGLMGCTAMLGQWYSCQ